MLWDIYICNIFSILSRLKGNQRINSPFSCFICPGSTKYQAKFFQCQILLCRHPASHPPSTLRFSLKLPLIHHFAELFSPPGLPWFLLKMPYCTSTLYIYSFTVLSCWCFVSFSYSSSLLLFMTSQSWPLLLFSFHPFFSFLSLQEL